MSKPIYNNAHFYDLYTEFFQLFYFYDTNNKIQSLNNQSLGSYKILLNNEPNLSKALKLPYTFFKTAHCVDF